MASFTLPLPLAGDKAKYFAISPNETHKRQYILFKWKLQELSVTRCAWGVPCVVRNDIAYCSSSVHLLLFFVAHAAVP